MSGSLEWSCRDDSQRIREKLQKRRVEWIVFGIEENCWFGRSNGRLKERDRNRILELDLILNTYVLYAWSRLIYNTFLICISYELCYMSGHDCCILLARLIYYLRIDIIFCYLTLLLNFLIKIIMMHTINERFDTEKLEIIYKNRYINRYIKKGSLKLLEIN